MKILRLISVICLLSTKFVFPQAYFQQVVNYTIDVKLNDRSHTLSGFETIEYINQSPDTLKFIFLHIWPNAYKNKNTALAQQLLENGETTFHYATPDELGYIDSLDFKVENEKIQWQYDKVHIDICKLLLPKPLAPGNKISISTPFFVKLPSAQISRLGHLEQAYMITQWYPKPAVYDASGWHPMPYLDQGEFFSEYGNFDVKITLPENYVIQATGDMVDAEKEIQFLQNKVETTEKKISQYEKGIFSSTMAFPESSNTLKTIRFKQTNIHDFAWFCDKRFNVLRSSVTLPKSGRTVNTWSLFTDKNLDVWRYSSAYLNDATFFYSLWNGDYPYNHVTAVDGTISAGGGMEYPNITVIGDAGNDFSLETVIMHEVGHNWFYGILGSNERENAWMDEGINSFNELRYIRTKYPTYTLGKLVGLDTSFRLGGLNNLKQKSQYELFYKYQAKRHLDQPCQMHSATYTETNYGAIVYSKTAFLFDYLLHYMGENDFDKAMQFYFENWKFKHPSPSDLRKTFEYFSEKDLSWFFDDLIKTTKQMDYKIKSVKKLVDGNFEIELKNCGDIAGPVAVCGLKNGKIKIMTWFDGFKDERKVTLPMAEVDEFQIDYFLFMPEINRQNNNYRLNKLIKRAEPLQLSLIGSLDNPNKIQGFFTPVPAYNKYNGFMMGLALYNHLLFQKNLEFELLPFYGFKNNSIAGYGNLQVHLFPEGNFFQKISLGIKAQRFAYSEEKFLNNYTKAAPYLNIEFKKSNLRSKVNNFLRYRYVFVNKEYPYYTVSANEISAVKKSFDYAVHDVHYIFENKNKLQSFTSDANFQASENGMKKTSVTLNYSWLCKLKTGKNSSKKSQLDLRLFAGKLIRNSKEVNYLFRMSGQTGYQDYLFDYSYFGRSERNPDLGFQQFTETDGAFKVWSPVGQSDDYMVSFNLKSPRLFLLPFYLYGDAGVFSTSGQNKPYETVYSFGIAIPLLRNYFEIFVPLQSSKNILDAQKANNLSWAETIRFTCNVNLVNPFNLIKNNLGI